MPMFKRADAEIHYEVHGVGLSRSCSTRRAG